MSCWRHAAKDRNDAVASGICGSQIAANFDYGATQLEFAKQQLGWLDAQLKGKEFIASPRYTMADIHALAAIIFGMQAIDLKLDPARKELTRWHATVSARPSASA